MAISVVPHEVQDGKLGVRGGLLPFGMQQRHEARWRSAGWREGSPCMCDYYLCMSVCMLVSVVCMSECVFFYI